MQRSFSEVDRTFLREAIGLAEEAGRRGNLPIGAVIVLDGQVISRGQNTIWQPQLQLTRHAEMEALRAVPGHLWPRSREMTLYTTLEPCVMCAGAVLLHHLGRLVFGAVDPNGGVAACLESLPPYFRQELALMEWRGPALPAECDPLYERIVELESQFESGAATGGPVAGAAVAADPQRGRWGADDSQPVSPGQSVDGIPEVSVQPVTRDNWREVARLQVEDAQREFVAEPCYYLALCSYGGDWKPLAVSLGDKVIGFVMWAQDPADGACWLGGILVDRSEQRRGYGRQAVKAAVRVLAEQHGYHHFALSYNPANAVAKHLYATLGFVETGEWEGDEQVARMTVAE